MAKKKTGLSESKIGTKSAKTLKAYKAAATLVAYVAAFKSLSSIDSIEIYDENDAIRIRGLWKDEEDRYAGENMINVCVKFGSMAGDEIYLKDNSKSKLIVVDFGLKSGQKELLRIIEELCEGELKIFFRKVLKHLTISNKIGHDTLVSIVQENYKSNEC